MKDYLGLTWSEYNQICKEKKLMDFEGKENNLKLDIALKEKQRNILSSAIEQSVELDKKAILIDSRKQERHKNERKETIMGEQQIATSANQIEEKAVETETTVESQKTDESDKSTYKTNEITLEEALNSMMETESELYGF